MFQFVLVQVREPQPLPTTVSAQAKRWPAQALPARLQSSALPPFATAMERGFARAEGIAGPRQAGSAHRHVLQQMLPRPATQQPPQLSQTSSSEGEV